MNALLLTLAFLTFDGNYSAWQRPFLAYDTNSEVWIASYVSEDGQAYEMRTKSGFITAVHVRYRGQCYTTSDAVTWHDTPCHRFLQMDAAFREVVAKHLRSQQGTRI